MRAEQTSARFAGFDILKCICAFLIVCIHCPFPGVVGEYFIALTRIAVPIFFMITGFYFENIKGKGREAQQIKKIAALVVIANILYAIWKSVFVILSEDVLIEYWTITFNLKNIMKFILLNDSPFNGHLWYLGAILYVLIIIYILDRIHLAKIIYVLTPILLIIDLILGKYSLLLFGQDFPYVLVRNFLFVGIPYFAIGMLIRSWENRGGSWKSKILKILIIGFSLTTLLERFLLDSVGANATRDHYISTTFLAVAVVLFFLVFYKNRKTGYIEEKMMLIGQKYSTGIYIIHPILITVFTVVAEKIGIFSVYSLNAPIIVYIFSIIGMTIYYWLIEKALNKSVSMKK